jgi:ubiquinone/menaquinone biosynthesis C-methylase UbiE
VPDWLPELLREDARAVLRPEAGGVATVLEPEGDAHAGRFEGLYGGVYDRVIQTDGLRRFASLAYGDAGPVTDLDGFVKRVATGTHAVRGRRPVLLDIPSGGGTLLPRLWRCGYRGRVIESDLGTAMLARAAQVADRVPLDVALLRADAQDLPLADGTVDAAVSLNGLHVMPDPRGFLLELGRVVRPRGRLWMVTLVSRGTRRADLTIRVGELTGILPGPPPTRATLLRWLADAGFAAVAPLGGAGLLGIAATRR